MDVTADVLSVVPGNWYGVVTLKNGSMYDVYARNLKEWIAAAEETAEAVGVTIDVWNTEVPE